MSSRDTRRHGGSHARLPLRGRAGGVLFAPVLARLVTPLLTLLLVAHAAAQGGSPPSRAAPLPADDTGPVDDLMAAFDAAYRFPAYDAALLEEAAAAARRAGSALVPALTLTQESDWPGYDRLSVDVSADLRVPLYDTRAGPGADLARADLEAARAAAAGSRARARLAYFADVAGAATLAEALVDLAAVMTRVARSPWLTAASFDPARLPPSERGAYEALLRLSDMTGFVASQSSEARSRIARAAGLPIDAVTVPTPRAVWAHLKTVAPTTPDHAACLAAAPAAEAARLRSEQDRLLARLDATVPVTVVLAGTAGVGVAGTAAGAGDGTGAFTAWGLGFEPLASVTLEARVALPVAHLLGPDAAAELRASASASGARQAVTVALPLLGTTPEADAVPTTGRGSEPASTVAQPAAWAGDRADDALAAELALVAADLHGLRDAVARSEADRARIERALAWLALDNGIETAHVAGGRLDLAALPDTLAVEAADLGTQLLFADLDVLVATAQLLSACGAWP